jgi:hypothetical protein
MPRVLREGKNRAIAVVGVAVINIWDCILTFATTAGIRLKSKKKNVPETARDRAIVSQSSFSLPHD